MDCECRAFCWDGPNCLFRPSKLVRFSLKDGWFTLLGDDGGFTERQVKVGGCAQEGANAVVQFDDRLDTSVDSRPNFLSTVLKEFHCVSVVTPHCLCCRSARSSPGYRFCDTCNHPAHLSHHYFPSARYLGWCCVVRVPNVMCCDSCFRFNLRGRRYNYQDRSVRVLEGNPEIPQNFDHDCAAAVMRFLFVGNLMSAYVEEWNAVSRDDSFLLVQLNFRRKFIYKSSPAQVFESDKRYSRLPWLNEKNFDPAPIDVCNASEYDGLNEDAGYVTLPDPYVRDIGSRPVELERPLLVGGLPVNHGSGVTSYDAQTMPVLIHVEFGYVSRPVPDVSNVTRNLAGPFLETDDGFMLGVEDESFSTIESHASDDSYSVGVTSSSGDDA